MPGDIEPVLSDALQQLIQCKRFLNIFPVIKCLFNIVLKKNKIKILYALMG